MVLGPGPSLDGNPVLWREWHRARPSWMARVVWLMYSALGLLWVGLTIYNVWARNGPGDDDEAVIGAMIMIAFQVGPGLLLLSAGAATCLSEERARGNLDLLMSTPLSTQAILAGKWWGTFRQAVPVLVWPAAIGGVLVALDLRRAFGWLALLALISAYVAAIVSLGLLQAVQEPRPGRAAARCIGIGIFCAFVWPVVAGFLTMQVPASQARDFVGYLLWMASPLMGLPMAGLLMMMPGDGFLSPAGSGWPQYAARTTAALFGTAALWGLAALLFRWTVNIADKRLGRMPETPERGTASDRFLFRGKSI